MNVPAITSGEALLMGQGAFVGIILVMALYNGLIYLSTRDVSYLYYVLSIVGIGCYFAFFYGFTGRYLWPDAPAWDAHSFALIVPLTGWARLMFTRTYLRTAERLPGWDQALRWGMALYLLPLAGGLFDYLGVPLGLKPVVYVLGVAGVTSYGLMLLVALRAYQQRYRPARYFLLASAFFIVGAVLFILREVAWLPETPVTRYAVQVGVLWQVVLFSLGLADRLNEARQQLTEAQLTQERQAHEAARQRERLIEAQKEASERLVAARTADLRHKTAELETTVTQLRASEARYRRLDGVKTRLFSIISHDLRQPLATLESFLNLLVQHADRLSPAEMTRLSGKTQQALKNLSLLLDNLLAWSQAQMERAGHHPATVALAPLVTSNRRLFAPEATQKRLTVTHDVPADLYVHADARALDFVLRNLILNAVKFTEPGGGIRVSATAQDGWATVAVRDTGVGIPPVAIPKLFAPDQPFTTKGTRKEKGTGLGLPLCQEFVARHGGKLTVESTPGSGTTFRFTLPLAVPSAVAAG